MAKRPPKQDPHAAREARRYERPIPSREWLLSILEDSATPLTHSELCRQLDLTDPGEQEALENRLRAMTRDGQVVRNRRRAYGLPKRMSLVRGRVQGHRNGFGYFIPESGGGDWFLPPHVMRRLLHDDEVMARPHRTDRRGRTEADVVEVLAHHTTQIVGRFYTESGVGFVVPDNPRIGTDLLVSGDGVAGARHGQYVVAEIIQYPDTSRGLMGRITEVLGDQMAPGMEIDVAIRSFQVPHEWPAAALDEAEVLPEAPTANETATRVDLRDTPLVTIDGEDARDFDDAVFAEPCSDGWRLVVAIADVSHYVRPGSALDTEAVRRGNSVYFPGRVVPMLPESLSNGLCSVNPDVERLCLVCDMRIDQRGELQDYTFYEGVMRSHARLTYTRVAQCLDGNPPDGGDARSRRLQTLLPHLKDLHALFEVLFAARQRRGAIDFETTETRIVFDANRKIEAIVPTKRTVAHRIIEECMLVTNVATARFLQKHRLPALYRVHEGPTTEKLENLRTFLGELGLSLGGGDSPSPLDYQKLLQTVADRPDAHMIQTVLLRSLKQARYQPENEGHFGLHYPAYAHFTSPIRRYPDLLVHRAIRSVIRSRRRSPHVQRVKGARVLRREAIYPYTSKDLGALGEQCSMTERRADDATRDVMAWLKCEYLRDHIGQTYPGVIVGVTGFGFFVELEELFVEGLVHVSTLDNDYYHFDAPAHRLVGEASRRVFQLGDRVEVTVAGVHLDDRKIDFELVRQLDTPGKRRRKSSPGSTKERSKRGSDRNRSSRRRTASKKSGRRSRSRRRS